MNLFTARLKKQNIGTKIIILFLFFMVFSISLITYLKNDGVLENTYNYESSNIDSEKPKISANWYLNLTNYQINKTHHYHNETIPVQGRLQYINGTGIQGYNVAIFTNGVEDSNFNDITDGNGEFQINYTIPFSLNIYQGHKIQVEVIESTPGTVRLKNHLIIYTNATSYFDITSLSPALPGENYNIIHGNLRFDNGTGIPNQQITSSWYNNSIKIKDDLPFFTTNDGSLTESDVLEVPKDNYSSTLFLNLSYSGNPPINNTQSILSINLFRNITCIWNIASSASEGAQITIRGQVLSRNNTNIKINNRDVDILYDGQLAGTITTNDNGDFQFTYQDPGGTGNKIIEVAIVHNLGSGVNIYSNTSHTIRITTASISETSSTSGKSGPKDPPFFNFFLVLIPIIIGGAVAFAIYARFFLKKQKEESMLVKLPLESRIRNLKILKDTGRLEESLSYLFQSIYMELINGKYGRRIKETETIRDFAIISVKNLNLNPAAIYPFIQKLEEIIYARPFIINDKDFYETVELFSPIYFELTGYNFVLNF